MRGKIKLKNKKHKYKKVLFFLTIIFIIVGTYLTINYVGNRLGKKLLEYASNEVGRIARYVVNYACSTDDIKELEFNDLFVMTKNQNDEIKTIDFNPIVVNNILNAVTKNVIKYFKALEEGNLEVINLKDNFFIKTDLDKLKEGIVVEIPMGAVTGNALLANLGPKIPVKLLLTGDIESYIDTDIKYYGINNALITIYVNLKVSEEIYMPITTGRVTISQKIPIAIKLIQGIVPNFYFDNMGISSIVDNN